MAWESTQNAWVIRVGISCDFVWRQMERCIILSVAEPLSAVDMATLASYINGGYDPRIWAPGTALLLPGKERSFVDSSCIR